MGGVREAGEEGAGSGIPKVVEGKNFAIFRNTSQSKKCKEAGANKYRVGTGIKGYGKREVYSPLFPLPHFILILLQLAVLNVNFAVRYTKFVPRFIISLSFCL